MLSSCCNINFEQIAGPLAVLLQVGETEPKRLSSAHRVRLSEVRETPLNALVVVGGRGLNAG